MRILLIATNQHNRLMSRMNARPMPIGLAYVAGYVNRERHELKLLDLMFSEDYQTEVSSVLKEFQPELVGLSIRNLDNQSYLNPRWALPLTKEVISLTRSLTGANVVCGGPAFSILPRQCFEYLDPDWGIAGDAGEAFAELADRLAEGADCRSLEGLVYRDGGEIIFTGARCASSFSKPPALDLLNMERYNKAGFGIGVLTKLGDFAYPNSPDKAKAEASAWRVIRPIPEVMAEVTEMWRRHNLKKVFFIDSAFNLPQAHARELCQQLEAAEMPLRWNTCLAPHTCDAGMISAMKRAGCALVIMNGAGGSSHDGPAPGANLNRLKEICQLCEDGGLRYTISQNFGEPGENRETVEEKLEFLRGINPALANLRVGMRIYPGTPAAQRAIAEGQIADEADLIRPHFYLAEPVRGWIVDYLNEQAAHQPRWNLL